MSDAYYAPPDNAPPLDDADAAADAAWLEAKEQADETAKALRRLRGVEAAREILRAEKAAQQPAAAFDADLLVDVLARPTDPPHRVERLIPSDGGTLIVAQRKTGKTTIELNLARSLITGETFLDAFPVRPVQGCVALLNYEVSAAQIARWAADHDVPDDRLLLVNLRGRRNPLTDPDARRRLSDLLRAHDTESLIVDPFGRAYTGQSQNDPGEVGAWLVDLDMFARTEAGATDLILTAHAGWNGERSRGSSSLEDWADSIITLTKDDDQIRYLRAEGRDVDVEEDRLHYDERTRRLTLTGTGSRRQNKQVGQQTRLTPHIVELVQAAPGIGTTELIKALRDAPSVPLGWQDNDARKAITAAVQGHLIRAEGGGPGIKRRHYPTTPSNPVQTPSETHPLTPSTPVYMDGVGVKATTQPRPPDGPTAADAQLLGERCLTCHYTRGAHTNDCPNRETA